MRNPHCNLRHCALLLGSCLGLYKNKIKELYFMFHYGKGLNCSQVQSKKNKKTSNVKNKCSSKGDQDVKDVTTKVGLYI